MSVRVRMRVELGDSDIVVVRNEAFVDFHIRLGQRLASTDGCTVQ